MTKGNVRKFGTVLGLSIITLGIYILYWLYVNLKEMREAFTFGKEETTIITTQKLFPAYIVVSIIVAIGTFSLTLANRGRLGPAAILLSVVGGVVAAVFYYHFTASVALGQKKAQVTAFEISSLYSFYIIGLVSFFIGNFVPFMSLLGIVFVFVYMYRTQQQINRIWLEGTDRPEQEVTLLGSDLGLDAKEEPKEGRQAPANQDLAAPHVLPKDISCPHCGEELELDEHERIAGQFTCPECNTLIDVRATQIPASGTALPAIAEPITDRQRKQLDKNKIASVAGFVGGGVFLLLNLVTKGKMPGGFQGGVLGFVIGYGLAWLVLAFIPSKKKER